MSTIKFEPQQGAGGGGGGSDVDREYVDLRDQDVLSDANTYTDEVAATKVNTSDYTAGDKATLGRLNNDFSVGTQISASEQGFNITNNKLNPSTGNTTSVTTAVPYASSEAPGAMSVATFNAVVSNSANIDAILSGAVSIDHLSADPTQEALTAAWQTATGLTDVINGAKINDSTNQKVWTYYTNTATWYPATNTAHVTVNTATNTSKGIVQGDGVNNGSVSVAANGTMSVNGWASYANAVANNTAAIATKANTADLAAVATSGDYDDLGDKPTYPVITAEWDSVNQRFDATTGENLANVPDGTKFKVKFDTAINNNGIALKIDGIGYAFIVTTDAVSNSTGATTNLQDTNTTYIYEILKQTIGGNLYWTCTNSFTDMQVPTITMTTTDPGEGSPLAANNFIAVYE